MKTLIFTIIFALTAATTFAAVQDPQVGNFILSAVADALKQLITETNWVFVVVFTLTTWLINSFSDATNIAGWLNWLGKIPKVIRAIACGLCWIIIFAWKDGLKTKNDLFLLLISMLIAMVIYKLGIGKILDKISLKLGLKFE